MMTAHGYERNAQLKRVQSICFFTTRRHLCQFTYALIELAWKTLKNYPEAQGVLCAFPRDVLKQAFHYEILENGEILLEMLSKRNLLAHTYDERLALEAYRFDFRNVLYTYAEFVGLVGWPD